MSKQSFRQFSAAIEDIPPIALGTSRLHDDHCVRVTEMAINRGFRIIDTASSYKNEREVARGIAASGIERTKLFLITKIHLNAMKYKDAINEMERVLTLFQTDYLDLLLIHWPCPSVSLRETLAALDYLHDNGWIRFYGVSNFPLSYLEYARALTDNLMVAQTEHHPFFKDNKLFDFAAREGMFVMSYRPTARGEASAHPVIADIARQYDVTPHQVILKWQMSQRNNIPVCGASSEAHLVENISACNVPLTAVDLAGINAIVDTGRTLIRDYAPDWNSAVIPPSWL